LGTPRTRPLKKDLLSTALPDNNLNTAVIINAHEKMDARNRGFSEGGLSSEKTFIIKSPVPIDTKRINIIKTAAADTLDLDSVLRDREKSRIVTRDSRNPAV